HSRKRRYASPVDTPAPSIRQPLSFDSAEVNSPTVTEYSRIPQQLRALRANQYFRWCRSHLRGLAELDHETAVRDRDVTVVGPARSSDEIAWLCSWPQMGEHEAAHCGLGRVLAGLQSAGEVLRGVRGHCFGIGGL